MPSDKKKVVIQYRRLHDEGGFFAGTNLQTAIRRAMQSIVNGDTISKQPDQRACDIEQSFGTVLLNFHYDSNSSFFGELVRFKPGAQIPLLHMDILKDGFYDLKQANAEDGHEAINGLLYFMVYGNHVTYIEVDLSTSRLERYLRWLLTTATNILPQSAGISLIPEILSGSRAQRLSLINQARINPNCLKILEQQQSELSSEKSKYLEISTLKIFDVLRAVGVESADIQEILEENTDIELRVEIKFRNGRKKKMITGEQAAALFRNLDLDDVTLYGPGGIEKEGRLVKLSYQAEVLTNGSLLNPNDVARALGEARAFFIEQGHIAP